MKYFCNFSHCLTGTRSIGKFNIMKISWLQNDVKKAKNIDQIVRTLLTQNNTQWAFHLSKNMKIENPNSSEFLNLSLFIVENKLF